MELRPYQRDCIDAVLKGWNEYNRQLLVVPTGGGKTIIFARLAQNTLPSRTLILAHRDELVRQAVDKIEQATGMWATVEKGQERADRDSAIVVGSIQTMMNRTHEWASDHFDLIVCDEAHHCISDSWQKVLTHFNTAKVLGVTATPDRGDKKNLGQYFENVAHEVHLRDLIADGYLSPIKIKAVPLELDISNVASVAGDYHVGQLGESLTPYLKACAEAIKEHAAGRKTLVFLPLVATSIEFAEIARSIGLKAEHVSGQSEDRKRILKNFASGDSHLLSNAMLLTEGYDCPTIDCVCVLRPTKSRALFAQMVGRGTRIAEGKTDLMLLDFLWQHERHDLVRPAHLVAESREVADLMTKQAFAGGDEALDLFELEVSAKEQRESTLRDALKENKKRKARMMDAMEFSLGLHDVTLAEYEPTMGWESKPVSVGQVRILKQYGIDPESVRGRGHASAMIDKIITRSRIGMATPKQMLWLRKLNHPTPEQATFDEAKEFLNAAWGGGK